MKIAIGADHAGFDLKGAVIRLLAGMGHQVDDRGTDAPGLSVDYPDFARDVAGRVAAGGAEAGILVCGSGIGMSIAANKVPGVRAALCHDVVTARLAREHNDANVLCLGGRTTAPETALEIVRTFLTSRFEGGRHARRLEKIADIERKERSA